MVRPGRIDRRRDVEDDDDEDDVDVDVGGPVFECV